MLAADGCRGTATTFEEQVQPGQWWAREEFLARMGRCFSRFVFFGREAAMNEKRFSEANVFALPRSSRGSLNFRNPACHFYRDTNERTFLTSGWKGKSWSVAGYTPGKPSDCKNKRDALA